MDCRVGTLVAPVDPNRIGSITRSVLGSAVGFPAGLFDTPLWLGVAVAVKVILIMLYLFPEMLHVAQDATGN